MSDVRARLAEALRGHQRNPYGQHDGWWECSCSTDEPHTPEHMADVLLSLEGVAIVALPEPDSHSPESWVGKSVTATRGLGRVRCYIDDARFTVPAARELAAALLAASDAAEAATDA